MVGKLFLFLALIGGSLSRTNPVSCKFFSVLSHWAMCVSFCHMIWFGLMVAYMLWRLKRDMAALNQENQNSDMTKSEMMTFIVIWLGTLFLVISFWFYDTYIDAVFGYGEYGHCLVTGQLAVKYALVIPSSVMVLFNFGLILFCVILFVQLIENSSDVRKKLVIFLSRLITLQTCQWAFGLAHYFSEEIALGYIFEVLISFEGSFIAITRYFFGI